MKPFKPQASQSDEKLIERVSKRREAAAFQLLYERYAGLVFTLAVHMLGRGEAEEATQEIFLRLWDRADRYHAQRGAFKSWFMALARNYMRDQLRHSRFKRMVDVDSLEAIILNVEDPQGDVFEEIWQRGRRDIILEAMKALPAAQRKVILLAYFGGNTQAVIAEQLDLPLGTVKKRIRLGMHKLRNALQGEAFLSFVGTAEVNDESRAK